MLIIFDLDGTLLNTIADLAAAANHALERAGFPTHSPEAYPYFVGNGVTRLLERVLPESRRSAHNVELLRCYFTEYYNTHLSDYTTPYPGMVKLLERLREQQIKVAVASNKYQSAVDKLIRHYFPTIEWSAICGHVDGMPTKPDPSIVFEILNQSPSPKAQTIFVGDSGVDMDTARRAGITSIGVKWGFRPESELREHYADYIVDKPDDIFAIALSERFQNPA